MRPADREGGAKGALRPSRGATGDYRAKTAYEISVVSRRMKESGHPAPLGDPTSGVVLVVEQPVGPRILQALDRSLKTVGLPEIYVTYASTGLLAEEILAAEPHALVALGPGAAREIDALSHPPPRPSSPKPKRGSGSPGPTATRDSFCPPSPPPSTTTQRSGASGGLSRPCGISPDPEQLANQVGQAIYLI